MASEPTHSVETTKSTDPIQSAESTESPNSVELTNTAKEAVAALEGAELMNFWKCCQCLEMNKIPNPTTLKELADTLRTSYTHRCKGDLCFHVRCQFCDLFRDDLDTLCECTDEDEDLEDLHDALPGLLLDLNRAVTQLNRLDRVREILMEQGIWVATSSESEVASETNDAGTTNSDTEDS